MSCVNIWNTNKCVNSETILFQWLWSAKVFSLLFLIERKESAAPQHWLQPAGTIWCRKKTFLSNILICHLLFSIIFYIYHLLGISSTLAPTSRNYLVSDKGFSSLIFSCPEQLKLKLELFVSDKAIQISGFSINSE